MAIQLYQLSEELIFPHPTMTIDEPEGLLAFGGDLLVERLVLAYQHGIFPWYSEGEPILWWSPDPRMLLYPDKYHASGSFRKFLRKTDFSVTLNKDFDAVIDACAHISRNDSGTWITEDMKNAYKDLHAAGYAHSIEVWDKHSLVGGLYGVAVGTAFCGESMFHKATNASKLAMFCLVQHMKQHNGAFIDCQMHTPHLSSLGAITVAKKQFLHELERSQKHSFNQGTWTPKIIFSGS